MRNVAQPRRGDLWRRPQRLRHAPQLEPLWRGGTRADGRVERRHRRLIYLPSGGLRWPFLRGKSGRNVLPDFHHGDLTVEWQEALQNFVIRPPSDVGTIWGRPGTATPTPTPRVTPRPTPGRQRPARRRAVGSVPPAKRAVHRPQPHLPSAAALRVQWLRPGATRIGDVAEHSVIATRRSTTLVAPSDAARPAEGRRRVPPQVHGAGERWQQVL